MHRNTIRFDTKPDIAITLIAQGTMWPNVIEFDGEQWERTDEVTATKPRESERIYRHVQLRRVG